MSKGSVKGILAGLSAILLWSWPPLVIKHLSASLDPYTQNFFRYLSAAVVLAVITAWRRKPVFPSRAAARGICVVVLFNVIFQTGMALSLYFIMPTQVVLVARTTVIFSAVLSAVLFREERKYVLSVLFVAGAVVALGGAVGFIFAGARVDWSLSSRQLVGYQCSIALALAWAAYTAYAKKTLFRNDAVTSFTQVSVLSAIVLGLLMFALGEPSRILRASAFDQCLVVFSGIVCVGVAHILYYYAVSNLGAAVCVTFTHLGPFFVGVLSRIFFEERLGGLQLLFGAAIIVGAALTVRSTKWTLQRTQSPSP